MCVSKGLACSIQLKLPFPSSLLRLFHPVPILCDILFVFPLLSKSVAPITRLIKSPVGHHRCESLRVCASPSYPRNHPKANYCHVPRGLWCRGCQDILAEDREDEIVSHSSQGKQCAIGLFSVMDLGPFAVRLS